MKTTLIAVAAGSAAAYETHTVTLMKGFAAENGATHYGDPAAGCQDDEVAIQIQNIDGAVCSPACTGVLKTTCPSDVPDGVTAAPQCALQDASSGSKYCTLICSPSTDEASLRAGDAQCGDATCKPIQGLGICTYDDDSKKDETLEEIAARVNAAKTTWKAEAPARFSSLDDVKQLCGTFTSDHPDFVRLPEKTTYADVEVPAEFDARTQWPECTVIGKIRDQSSCGSCWAFGSTESFEDRHCVATGKDVEFSAYDTAANCKGFACGMSQGCGGGQPTAAWNWFTTKGVVTGGDYSDVDSDSSCLPYPFEACAHHVNSTKYPACPTDEYSTKSTTSCSESGYSTSYSADKVKAKTSFSVSSNVDKIKAELVANGPLAVAFTVYSDFPTYKSGVYKHTSGSMLGGHAVELIGYGTEDGEDYWLVKNSWNEQWGDSGIFKIAHGECGIENTVSGGTF